MVPTPYAFNASRETCDVTLKTPFSHTRCTARGYSFASIFVVDVRRTVAEFRRLARFVARILKGHMIFV